MGECCVLPCKSKGLAHGGSDRYLKYVFMDRTVHICVTFGNAHPFHKYERMPINYTSCLSE